MHISVLLTSLPLPFAKAIPRAAALGFTHVDLIALVERPDEHREALADSGLVVSCASVGRDLGEGVALDAAAVEVRRAAVETMKRQIADAAQLGATACYLVSGLDATPGGLTRFAEGCALLADYAASRMVALCVEPIPGRALADAATTLAWLERLGHPNLKLLLDVGHCLISREDPTTVVRAAGARLGYVHLDDNDGKGDLHWPLLKGKLTEELLRQTFAALAATGYTNGVALELNPENGDPEQNLLAGRELLRTLS